MPAPEFEVVWGEWRREARLTPSAQAETVVA
jgi:hypothetical protein